MTTRPPFSNTGQRSSVFGAMSMYRIRTYTVLQGSSKLHGVEQQPRWVGGGNIRVSARGNIGLLREISLLRGHF